MLNRLFNLARRQEPQVFPPRKRAMANTSFGQAKPEDAEPATFIVEDAEPGTRPFGGPPPAAPAAKVVEGPGLALGQMRLAIEDGLLMVFGPERDPVPPHTFAAAAAAHPDVRLALPDGASVPASRAAAVLSAQALGRLGQSEPGSAWILAMLRDGSGPEPASEYLLAAEQVAAVPGNQPAVAADASEVAAGASSAGEQAAASEHDLPAAAAEAAPPRPRKKAAAPVRPPQPAVEPAPDVRQADLDADSMVLVVMHGVPEDAQLSTGVRDDDGSWAISPRDLATVTISLASAGSSARGSETRGADGDLNITGIALAENGELVAMSETVPLADYLGDPGGAAPAADAASDAEPRRIALDLNPPALAGGAVDALVIRDLPAGARLSAGAYDPAIDGWVLRPQDLSGLAILPPPEMRADFTVTLLGIALHEGDSNAARVLARLPVRLA
jgi:hypothetical protein